MTRWGKILLAAMLLTFLTTVIATAEEVDFYCTSSAAAELSTDPLTRVELIDAGYCGLFSERYGFVSRGELTHMYDVEGTALAVYKVDYPNHTYAYTVK